MSDLLLLGCGSVGVSGGGSPPVNTGLPAISGTAQQDQILSTSNGTWTNAPTSFTYQWKRAGSPISGATSSTYTVVVADIGNTLTVTVTAINGAGSAPATSTATGSVTADALRAFIAGDVPPGLFPEQLAGQDTVLLGPPPQAAAFI